MYFSNSFHFFISTEVQRRFSISEEWQGLQPGTQEQTKTPTATVQHTRVNIVEFRAKPTPVPPLFKVLTTYEQGVMTVEARPNYPCLRDLTPGTVVGFSNPFSDRSLLATITTRHVHRDFATINVAYDEKRLRIIYLPDQDPFDLQRAVNVYHSFRNGTYCLANKFIDHQHKVMVLRFEHVEPVKRTTPCIHVSTIASPYVRYLNM